MCTHGSDKKHFQGQMNMWGNGEWVIFQRNHLQRQPQNGNIDTFLQRTLLGTVQNHESENYIFVYSNDLVTHL